MVSEIIENRSDSVNEKRPMSVSDPFERKTYIGDNASVLITDKAIILTLLTRTIFSLRRLDARSISRSFRHRGAFLDCP
ncbi:hypothetical protein VTP01DRAFT_2827 [Rhizomucor pusillus]|uniref:uncharacterized protein n=1 Tax=Rhizomucor pusillus TaxID=4840 RepID=UPI00374214F6